MQRSIVNRYTTNILNMIGPVHPERKRGKHASTCRCFPLAAYINVYWLYRGQTTIPTPNFSTMRLALPEIWKSCAHVRKRRYGTPCNNLCKTHSLWDPLPSTRIPKNTAMRPAIPKYGKAILTCARADASHQRPVEYASLLGL